MFNSIFMKKIGYTFLVLMICFGLLTGCSGTKKNGSKKSDDGRSYGGLIEAEMEDTVETAFFNWKVESVKKYDTYQFDDGLYQAEEGKTYLVVKLTIENTFSEDLPMSITDFTLDYEGNKSKDIITGYGKSEIQKKKFMDNIFTLKKGRSVTKYILFTVKDKTEYSLNYTEFYADEFEGDSYRIAIRPDKEASKAKEEK